MQPGLGYATAPPIAYKAAGDAYGCDYGDNFWLQVIDIDTNVSTDEKLTLGRGFLGDRKSAVKFHKRVLDFLKTNTIEAVGSIVDNVFTNDEEKSIAKKQLSEVVLKSLNDIAEVQGEVVKTELQ